MILHALFLSTVAILAGFFWLLGEFSFLAPFRSLIVARWLPRIAWFFGLFWLNLTALIYILERKVLLKETGKTLNVLVGQLDSPSSISQELSDRLETQ